MSDFSARASARRAEIDAALDRFTQFGPGCPASLAEAIRYSLLAPGKRLRPLLVLMGAEACGCADGRAIPAACAVEMVHAYSLIHDDLPAMDDDAFRRGLPTCHTKFGEATAILAGDALLALAFETLTLLEPPAIAAACCRELAQAAGACALVGGQAADLAAEGEAGSLELLESIHRRKTGALFTASVRLGALVAEANEVQTSAITRFAASFGLAFQVIDDLLDACGESQELKKDTGRDAERGKLTFPALLGMEASRRRAEELVAAACRAVAPLGPSGEELAELARYALSRLPESTGTSAGT